MNELSKIRINKEHFKHNSFNESKAKEDYIDSNFQYIDKV